MVDFSNVNLHTKNICIKKTASFNSKHAMDIQFRDRKVDITYSMFENDKK